MKKQEQILEVAAIENGVVLDHLPSDKVLKILQILAVQPEHCITLGMNLKSKRHIRKGIIKISGRGLTASEMNKIAILAPQVTVNTIEKYKVLKKKKVALKEIEQNTILCNNPNCITNAEAVGTKFYILEKGPLKVRCYFCERTIEEKEIQFL